MSPRLIAAATWVFALTSLAIAAWMVLAPHSFFRHVGPFGTYNSHYLEDNASWQLAIGLAALYVAVRPRWRTPVLGLGALQTAIHAANHWVDVNDVHPGSSAGWFDAVSLTVGALALAAVAAAATRSAA